MRIPRELPARVVRRVVCESCAVRYDANDVEVLPSRRPRSVSLPRGLKLPRLRLDWRWLSIPVSALAVFAVLSALRDSGSEPAAGVGAASAGAPATAGEPQVPAKPATREPGAGGRSGKSRAAKNATVISEGTFTVALPSGWERTPPAGGATFAATAEDGSADVTLWVQRDGKLDFGSFEASSLAQLESLAGSAEVVERNVGPTVEESSITIAPAEAPQGAPAYEVALRGQGKNWYYLATTTQPDAKAETVKAVELIQGSFLPVGGAP